MDTSEVLVRIVVAALLGGAIGLDRELRGHAAGLRTNILVAGAAAVFADVSINGFAQVQGHDPSRVAADVVSGIGFLGAGAIFALGGRPRGLTTAAALWASAAVGLSVGVGRWETALTLVGVSLVTLVIVDALGDRLLRPRRTAIRDLYVVVADAADMSEVQRSLHDHDVVVRSLEMRELGANIGVDLVLRGPERGMADAVAAVGDLDVVRFASDERGTIDGS